MKRNVEPEIQSALMLLTLPKCESITKDHKNNSAIVKPSMHITIKDKFFLNAGYMFFLTQSLMVIVRLFLPMDRLVVVKPIQWRDRKIG